MDKLDRHKVQNMFLTDPLCLVTLLILMIKSLIVRRDSSATLVHLSVSRCKHNYWSWFAGTTSFDGILTSSSFLRDHLCGARGPVSWCRIELRMRVFAQWRVLPCADGKHRRLISIQLQLL